MIISALSLIMVEPSAFYAYQQSDSTGKFIVILLWFGSILTWTIMIEKGYSLFKAKRTSESFVQLFRSGKPVVSYIRDADRCTGPLAKVYEAGAEKLIEFYAINPEQALLVASSRQLPQVQLTDAQMEALRAVLEREVSGQIFKLEEKIGLLATAVSVSPLLGLFGTVWGVMIAFCGVAIAGKADIASMAPGISSALLTTVVGLVVAIPSVVGYNLLAVTIRKVTVMMDIFVEEFLTKVRLEQLED